MDDECCDKEGLETALERFNKEFQRMEVNFERLLEQQKKISKFITHQKNLFKKKVNLNKNNY